jgi:hypothetical protein
VLGPSLMGLGTSNMFMAPPVADTFTPVTIPAPVGGLNAYDSLAAMAETDAVIMQNWWPQPYGCSIRKGYIQWATGMPGAVETIAGWYNSSGGQKMFAWSVSSMYDVTTRAAVGAAMVTGLSNAKWETVVLTNTAGNFLICVNGVDNGIIYKDAGVFRITPGDGIVVNTWAGLSPLNAVQLTVHQRRLWAVEKNSSRGAYLPPDAIQGTFAFFDFGPQFKKGGYLQYLSTWTIDDGNGAEDHLVAVSSRGEAVVYGGTDPTSSTAWSLVGVYYIGSPVAGRRSYTKAGGDLLLLTQKGLVSLTGELVSTKVNEARNPLSSSKIQFLISYLVSTYGTLNGWQVVYHPVINMALINVPSVVAGGNAQLAANQIIQSWTQFLNMDSVCWCTHNDLIYFGDYAGVVHQAWTGNSDGVLLNNTGGEGVTASVQQAYTYFGGRANVKQAGLYRPVFVTGGAVSINAAIVWDFAEQDLVAPSVIPSPLGSLWGTGRWGSAFWSGGSIVSKPWITSEGMGVAASIKMVTLSEAEVLWIATDYSLVQTHGIL